MFLIVRIKKDTSIGNFTWGGGVLLLTLLSFFHIPLFITPRKILITSLITLWATRLITYIYIRYKKSADPRYVDWEKSWGKFSFLASFVWIVIMQGIMLLIMSFPSVKVNSQDIGGLNILDLIGLSIWVLGYFFESVGDYQLYKFMKDPNNKGKIMDRGLWKYTRHPNYFGEISQWWGIYLIACSILPDLFVFPGWTTIITPLTITILIVFFTGIPWVENVFKDNPAYQEYKKRTNMLIPWFPKK